MRPLIPSPRHHSHSLPVSYAQMTVNVSRWKEPISPPASHTTQSQLVLKYAKVIQKSVLLNDTSPHVHFCENTQLTHKDMTRELWKEWNTNGYYYSRKGHSDELQTQVLRVCSVWGVFNESVVLLKCISEGPEALTSSWVEWSDPEAASKSRRSPVIDVSEHLQDKERHMMTRPVIIPMRTCHYTAHLWSPQTLAVPALSSLWFYPAGHHNCSQTDQGHPVKTMPSDCQNLQMCFNSDNVFTVEIIICVSITIVSVISEELLLKG